mmetsp:Transcript_24546/g.27980  ORF Transcript_24546/g.27980 Transcript_24546/m.27980 type:complete len:947 (-) Transcript_24546:272-3112(-)
MEDSNGKKMEVENDKAPNGATTTTTTSTTTSTDSNTTRSNNDNNNKNVKKEDIKGYSSTNKEDKIHSVNVTQVGSNGKKMDVLQSSYKDESSSNAHSDDNTTTPKQEQAQYSTRGRNSSKEIDPELIKDCLDRISSSHRDLEDDTGISVERERNHSGHTTSFLDNINEQQRRTRTRFLPAVDGIHVLHKSEVKHDLQLARTVVSSSGVSSTLSSCRTSGGKRKDDGDVEMVDEEDGIGPSEDERLTDNVTIADNTNNNPSEPSSKAFIAPQIGQLHRQIYVNGDSCDGGNVGGETSSKVCGYTSSSPHIVESATAFNPPRPPESVGPKKKHRMMRWESRPEDVEVDLDSYRKTVQRTREELKNAQAERERIEAVSSYLRSHYLCQLSALNEEGFKLNEEFGSIQLDCVKAADLLQSRTRSRGVGKGSYVIKDVLNILKLRGNEVSSLPVGSEKVVQGEPSSGIGGINSTGLVDWTRGHEVESASFANGYVLAGNIVQTPYGKGEVKHVYGATLLDVKAKIPEDDRYPSSKRVAGNRTVQHGFGGPDTVSSDRNNVATKTSISKKMLHNSSNVVKQNTKNENEKKSQQKLKERGKCKKDTPMMNVGELLAPRVCVQLPFGIGYFRIDQVITHEPVASYSDSMLVSRWKQMVDTSLLMTGCIDFAAMADAPDVSINEKKGDAQGEDKNEGEDVIDTSSNEVNSKKINSKKINRFLPFGSGMMPTSCGRGVKLQDFPITSLEREMDLKLLSNGGILGVKHNKGVPEIFRVWEDIRDEVSVLHAQVLQRRNEIARQRRIRLMNERSLSSARYQSNRVESLVLEMRADLKSLKDRLDDELIELGIEGEITDRLLAQHYEEENFELSFIRRAPPKRKIRPTRERPYHHSMTSAKQTRRHRTASTTPDSTDNHSYITNERIHIEGKVRRNLSTDGDLEEGRQTKRARQKSIDL